MEGKNFKHIVGEAKENEIATIKFFGGVKDEMSKSFISEFDFLENVIKPSKIKVLINCEGGSVIHGMSVFSTISNSAIPTECIVEGIAASMGSVIWAAGDVSLMRDYSIVMIHNPFNPNEDKSNEPSDFVKACTKQIEAVYRKRFGLKKAQVKAIMDGEAGKDGTFFDAESAVRAGIIPANNVIETSQQVRDKVKNELEGLVGAAEMQCAIEKISCELGDLVIENKPSLEDDTNLNQKQNSTSVEDILTKTKNQMDNKPIELSAVAASLGMGEGYEIKDVMARITGLLSIEAKLTEATKELSNAKTVIEGKDATIVNIQASLDSVTADLAGYKAKEEVIKQAGIEALVQGAIDACKIEPASKAKWVEIANQNLELAESTLASIPAREKITEVIATDPTNVKNAADAVKTVDEKVAEQVLAVVGDKFEFKTLA